MSRNEWFLGLTEGLHSTVDILFMCYITCNWHNTFTVHVPNLITVFSHCLWSHSMQQMLRMPFMWINACMDTSDHELSLPFKGWCSCEWFDLHQKYAGEETLHFQLEWNWAWFLHVNTSKHWFLPWKLFTDV